MRRASRDCWRVPHRAGENPWNGRANSRRNQRAKSRGISGRKPAESALAAVEAAIRVALHSRSEVSDEQHRHHTGEGVAWVCAGCSSCGSITLTGDEGHTHKGAAEPLHPL